MATENYAERAAIDTRELEAKMDKVAAAKAKRAAESVGSNGSITKLHWWITQSLFALLSIGVAVLLADLREASKDNRAALKTMHAEFDARINALREKLEVQVRIEADLEHVKTTLVEIRQDLKELKR